MKLVRVKTWQMPLLIMMVIATVSIVTGINGNESLASNSRYSPVNPITMLKTLNEAIAQAESVYYKEIDKEKMYEGAIKGALAALDDPYTYYQAPRARQREQEDLMRARFGGLGIRIYADKGFVKIARPLPNTPAMRAGLQPGDYITKVDDQEVQIGGAGGQTLNDVVDILRGEVGTDVTIAVQRRGHSEPFDVTLTRAEIKIDSVEKTVIHGEIGYIRINSFTGRTSEEFRNAMDNFFDYSTYDKPEALIIDLRDNPGGLLNAAKYVADSFISKGMIVSTKGRRSKFNQEYRATPSTLCASDVELVLLVNEYSASGSEIVAGAIKDHARGVLIGDKTYGKGVVQQRFPMRYGGAVSLTISTYFTPNGGSIHEKGIEPHVNVKAQKLEAEAVAMRSKMREKRYVAKFVEKWIEEEEKSSGKTPKDFSELAKDLPSLMSTLKENKITLDEKIVQLEAERIFNNNVGIYKMLDLENDRQLQEAITLIESGRIDEVLRSANQNDNSNDTADL